MEGQWPCYGGGQFNGGKMVLLQRRLVQWRGNGHVTGLVSLMEGEMVMLRIMSLEWREKGHVRESEVVSLMEGE